MKKFFYSASVLMICALPLDALAQGRVDSRSLTCSEAKALVKSEGAVMMTTGASRFDRVVRKVRFCHKTERLKKYFAPTSDKTRCNVGYVCVVATGKSG